MRERVHWSEAAQGDWDTPEVLEVLRSCVSKCVGPVEWVACEMLLRSSGSCTQDILQQATQCCFFPCY